MSWHRTLPLGFCGVENIYTTKLHQWQHVLLLLRMTKTPHAILRFNFELDAFVKQGCPPWQQSQSMAKSVSSTFWPHPTLRGRRCQWDVCNPKMNLQSKFGYCIATQNLNVAAGRNYWQTDRQTDDPITRCPPVDLSGWAIKIWAFL